MTMMTIQQFIRTLDQVARIEVPDAQAASLEEAGSVIDTYAKAQIGHYDLTPPAGFPSWPQLADSTKKDRVREGFPENEPLLRTGELRDSIHHEVLDFDLAVVGSDSDIMVYQELGTETIPPRPVMGPAAVRMGPKVADMIGAAVVDALTSKPYRRKVDPDAL